MATVPMNTAEMKEVAEAGQEKCLFTYFMHSPMLRAIKIGKTSSVKRRCTGLQTGSAEKLLLLATVVGNQEDELHKKFESAWITGEWFSEAPILAYLKAENLLGEASEPDGKEILNAYLHANKQARKLRGREGGIAAGERMSPDERTARAKKAAAARWAKTKEPEPIGFRTLDDFRAMLRANTVGAGQAHQ